MVAGPQSTTSVATFGAAEAIVWVLELEELLELLEPEEPEEEELEELEPPPPHPTRHPIAIAMALKRIRRTSALPTV